MIYNDYFTQHATNICPRFRSKRKKKKRKKENTDITFQSQLRVQTDCKFFTFYSSKGGNLSKSCVGEKRVVLQGFFRISMHRTCCLDNAMFFYNIILGDTFATGYYFWFLTSSNVFLPF